jgi:hypothetical protein
LSSSKLNINKKIIKIIILILKGKGKQKTFWLVGKEGFTKELPEPINTDESHGSVFIVILFTIRENIFNRVSNFQGLMRNWLTF